LIELAWLLRDLRRGEELLPILESAPPTPWVAAATAVARDELREAVDLVSGIGAPVVEAYTRLRAAEELVRSGERDAAREQFAQALDFFRKAGATHYIGRAELLAASA
jgi:hypothetical protein